MKEVIMSKKPSEKKEASLGIRVFVIYLCIILTSVGVSYRIIDLQFSHKNELRSRAEAEKKTLKPEVIPIERGVILSRDNKTLTKRLPKYKIYMDTYPIDPAKGEKGNSKGKKTFLPDTVFNNHVAALGDSLTKLFGKTTPSWEQQLKTARSEQKRHFKISDNADRIQYMRVKTFPIFNKYNVLCNPEEDLNHTEYYYNNLAHRTLGEARMEAPVGLEGYFDKELSGTPGLILRKKIGNISIDIESENNIQPRDGYNVTTTLDMTIQDIANIALLNSLHQYNAEKGCVIVMEVTTGDVLAMVNISKDTSGNYRETENNALTEYEPGSTFKTASLMVALEDGKVSPNTRIPVKYTSGYTASVGNRKVTDDHGIKVDTPELWYIFAQSSNVGVTKVIYENYASCQQQFIDGLYKLGFGDTLRFPVSGGNKKPLLRSTTDRWWSKTSISTIPMGYEVEVTPLHLLTFYNAIANNGCMVQPRLVTKISSKNETIRTFNVDTLNARICSEQTLLYIRSMLDSVITCGTGRKGFMDAPYKTAGKTGTSEDLTAKNKGKNLYNASFCGYFPADNPKYSCVVVIKGLVKKDNHYYGGTVALPVFRDIADKIYATDYDLMPKAKATHKNKTIIK